METWTDQSSGYNPPLPGVPPASLLLIPPSQVTLAAPFHSQARTSSPFNSTCLALTFEFPSTTFSTWLHSCTLLLRECSFCNTKSRRWEAATEEVGAKTASVWWSRS